MSKIQPLIGGKINDKNNELVIKVKSYLLKLL